MVDRRSNAPRAPLSDPSLRGVRRVGFRRPPRRGSGRGPLSGEGANAMKVKEAMSNDVLLVNPDQTIRDAAQMMIEIDAGVLPVAENDRLVGMITDRDIAVRAVALGKSPETRVREIMSGEVLYCFDDEELAHVSRNMSDMKVRRLPVVNRDKRLVGLISVGDLARHEQPTTVGRMVARVSEPGGKHSQAAH
jgi:CBS domain-containing protein